MELNLNDKVVLVTGAGRGLGRAIALGFAAEGAHVAINYSRSAEAAEELARQIVDEHGVKAIAVGADVAVEADVERMFDEVTAALGPVDVLVNNAAVWSMAFVKDLTVEQWERTFAVNATAPFLTSRRLVRDCLDAGRTASIINVATPAAFRGAKSGCADYAASKAAVVNFTITLARELAAHGIRVNAVAPGMLYTDMTREALDDNMQQYIDRTPMRRIGDPAEIADAIVFLASERASYTTGTTMDVSGGMMIG
jgi:3-oxoacyl-[acyl-carrier protein] reductase